MRILSVLARIAWHAELVHADTHDVFPVRPHTDAAQETGVHDLNPRARLDGDCYFVCLIRARTEDLTDLRVDDAETQSSQSSSVSGMRTWPSAAVVTASIDMSGMLSAARLTPAPGLRSERVVVGTSAAGIVP